MLTVSAFTACLAIAVGQAQEVKLAWVPQVGTTYAWNMTVSMNIDAGGQDMAMEISMLNKNKTVKVENGLVTFESSMADMKMTMNGEAFTPPGSEGQAPEAVTTVYKLDGTFVSRKGGGEMASSVRAEQMNAFIYPSHAVKINEPWFKEFPADKENKIPVAKARYTLLGEEMVGKYRTWKIEKVYAELDDPQGFSSMGTVWLDQTDGSMVKYEGEFTNVKFVDMMPPTSGKVKISRAG